MSGPAYVTKHGEQRTKERVGISKKIAEKNAEKALAYGVTHAEAKGNLHKYFDRIYLSHKKANNIRVYNRYVYVFCGNILLTVLPLPNNLYPIADKLQKQK